MENEVLTQKKPIDYIKIIFRRKWFIIIPAVIGIIGGIIMANTSPKEYRSSTLILVEEGRVINPLVRGLAVSTSVAQRLGILREQILGWDRLNQLVSKLNLAKDVKTQQDFENLILRLRRRIAVTLRGRSIIGIAYTGKDPVQAMNIVKTITDIFIAENLKQQNQETDNAISFINDQLALYQQKLKQGEISAMEDKLKALMIDSTDRHPMVINLRKRISVAEKEMEEGNYEINTSAIAESNGELASLKEELKELRKELTTSSLDTDKGGENRAKFATTTNEKLYKLLLLERVQKISAKDTGVNRGLYNELLRRLETAKITQSLEASKDGTRYIILDPARLPLKPIKPNKLNVLLTGMFVGICCGLGLIFVVEMFDHSFLGIDDAKAHLELPVLGAISKIVTEKDVRAQKLRNIKITSASVLTGTVLLVVIIFNVLLGG